MKALKIGELTARIPVIQGGMGVGISLSGLAGSVAACGGVGVISTAQIGYRDPEFEKDPIKTNLRVIGEEIQKASVIIVIAGMEGALVSVVGGLVDVPVIAVPTSIGYGSNLQGLTTLMSMLTSCASGVTVVNIDNGFGAAYSACMINRLNHNRKEN